MKTTECIKWHLYITKEGYGQANIENQKHIKAHKWIWIQNFGPIPEGMVVDHMCHNEAVTKSECNGGPTCEHRACVNPTHLRLVTVRENTMAGLHNIDNRSHCKKGHLFRENLMVRKSGKRECSECNRIRARANYAKKVGA